MGQHVRFENQSITVVFPLNSGMRKTSPWSQNWLVRSEMTLRTGPTGSCPGRQCLMIFNVRERNKRRRECGLGV
jgi:hypothetical protein